MKFKYRFKGKVNSQLVLRGMLFKVGSKIDFCVSETELDFVKKHCSVDEIIDLSDDVIMEKVIYISTEDLNFHYVEMKVFSDNNIVYSIYENMINDNKSEEAKAYVDSITKQATEKCPF